MTARAVLAKQGVKNINNIDTGLKKKSTGHQQGLKIK